jgi:hypothetical protein
MGHISTAILAGCLNALGWLLWATAALLVVLVIVQALRGDADALPKSNLLVATAFLLAGGACAWAARRVARLQ